MAKQWQRVRIKLDVTMDTDRGAYDMGRSLAAFLEGTLRDENPGQPIDVECADTDVLYDVKPPEARADQGAQE